VPSGWVNDARRPATLRDEGLLSFLGDRARREPLVHDVVLMLVFAAAVLIPVDTWVVAERPPSRWRT
jgi:hypothetical protein